MSTSFLPQIKCTTVYFLVSFLSIIVTNAKLTYIDQFCDPRYGNYSVLSDYEDNVKSAIMALAAEASTSYYSTHTAGIGEDKVNALYLCRNDITPKDCQSCVASAMNITIGCLFMVESITNYEECTVHYSKRAIFSEMEDLPRLYEYSTNSADREVHFFQYLKNYVAELVTDASSSSQYFATKSSKYSSSETLYALAQCNPDITSLECKTCLQTGFIAFTANYSGRVYGQIFSPSCRLSYILTTVELSRPWKFSQTFKQEHGVSTFTPIHNGGPTTPTITPDQHGEPSPTFTPGHFSSTSGGARRNYMMSPIIAIITIMTSRKLFL